jgi:glycosyltransferase involved in cell wall biosynthesis
MRVLHWYANFFGGGGVANAVLGLARHQAALGAEVAIGAAAPDGPPLYEPLAADKGVKIIEWRPVWMFRRGGITWRWMSRGGAARLRAFHPDVVHIHGELVPDNVRVPRLFACPLVISPHGTFHPAVFVKSRSVAKRLYIEIARRLLYRRAAAFHALSPFEAAHIVRVFPGGNVYCVPQGPGTAALQGGGRAAHGADDPVDMGTTRFLFVGRLDVYTKGLDLLLDAFAAARRRNPARRLSLRMVGPEWRGSLAWLRHRAGELEIADGLRFSGALPSSAVAQALRQCDVYIQLSRHDSFPLSVVEALLAGKPAVLSSAVGPVAYPEVGELPHVRVVPPDAAAAAAAMIEAVERLPDLNAAAAEHLGEVREFFSWDRAARRQLEMYSRLCAASVTHGATVEVTTCVR